MPLRVGGPTSEDAWWCSPPERCALGGRELQACRSFDKGKDAIPGEGEGTEHLAFWHMTHAGFMSSTVPGSRYLIITHLGPKSHTRHGL